MHAQIERLLGIVQSPPPGGRFQAPVLPLQFQLPPTFQRPRRIGGIAQKRRAGQQALVEPADDAIGNGRVHAKVIGMENDPPNARTE